MKYVLSDNDGLYLTDWTHSKLKWRRNKKKALRFPSYAATVAAKQWLANRFDGRDYESLLLEGVK